MNNKSIVAEAIKAMIKEEKSPRDIYNFEWPIGKKFIFSPGYITQDKDDTVTMRYDGKTGNSFKFTIVDSSAHPQNIGKEVILTEKQYLHAVNKFGVEGVKEEVKEDDAPASNKLSQFSLGMKTARVVISGEDVTKNHEKILKLGQDIDPNFEAKYYEATEKIVGSMSKVKIQPLNLKFRDRSLKAVAEDKPQTKK